MCLGWGCTPGDGVLAPAWCVCLRALLLWCLPLLCVEITQQHGWDGGCKRYSLQLYQLLILPRSSFHLSSASCRVFLFSRTACHLVLLLLHLFFLYTNNQHPRPYYFSLYTVWWSNYITCLFYDHCILLLTPPLASRICTFLFVRINYFLKIFFRVGVTSKNTLRTVVRKATCHFHRHSPKGQNDNAYHASKLVLYCPCRAKNTRNKHTDIYSWFVGYF